MCQKEEWGKEAINKTLIEKNLFSDASSLRLQSGNLKWIWFLIFNFVIITFVGFPFVEIVSG